MKGLTFPFGKLNQYCYPLIDVHLRFLTSRAEQLYSHFTELPERNEITLKRIVPFLLLLPVGILLAGYLLRPAPEVLEQRSPEQDAILLYSDKTQSLEETMRAFETAWALAHEKENGPEDIRKILHTEALPAMEILLDSLKSAGPDLPELKKIHAPLQGSYEKAFQQLKSTCDRKEGNNFVNALEQLTESMENLLEAHRVYGKEIRAFYALNNVYPPTSHSTEESPEDSPESTPMEAMEP